MGRIEDRGTGIAVAGATVRVVAGGGAVVTDDVGRFRLAGVPPGAMVEVVASGYRRRLVELPASGVIQLEPDPFELDAVTVNATRNPEAQTDRTSNYAEDFIEADVQLSSSLRTGAVTHAVTYGLDGGLTRTDYERVDVTRNLTTGARAVARAGGFNFANAETVRLDAYLQDEIRMLGGALAVIPGLRVAHYRITPEPNEDYQPVEGKEPREVSRTTATPKIGVIVRDRSLSLHAQYAVGFKMPTAQQLYTSLPGSFFVLVPNPDLLPEEVDAFEVGVRGGWGRGFLAVNGFFNDYENFIQSFVEVPDTDPLEITYDNLASVQVLGVEASAAWRWTDRFVSTGTLSYQRGDQRADSAAPETTPFDAVEPLAGTIALRYMDPALGFDAELNGRSRRVRNAPAAMPSSARAATACTAPS